MKQFYFLFFYYYHCTRLLLLTLTSFITGCHERSFVKEGCKERDGKVDSDLRNAPHVKATAVKEKDELAYVLQPRRIQS